TNYAVGRARARPTAPVFRFYDLSTQVGLFLSGFGGHASPDNLYVIWIGGNDLRDALETLPSDPSSIIGAAVAAVAANIQALWLAGARTFLIPDVPNPANTPAVRALGPVAQFAATQLMDAHNGALHLALNALQAALPGIRLIRLDVNALFGDLPSELNTEDSCLTFGVIGVEVDHREPGILGDREPRGAVARSEHLDRLAPDGRRRLEGPAARAAEDHLARGDAHVHDDRVIGAERAGPLERGVRDELRIAPGEDLHVLRQYRARVEPLEQRPLVLGWQRLALPVREPPGEGDADDDGRLADLGRPEVGGTDRHPLDAAR